ncbi:Chimeric ERCC6-PGBD3 protein [Anabarilius grahami]|uniref:Chimeric ERCC6-PGBD3 protein n=1 Tax=Anabarilius grahami TaxID=495550 RepID=A0A3N0XKS8_ANAGA|nr:Chimeric ERCC6-PGBD3 protein [Anabarilius grahami]
MQHTYRLVSDVSPDDEELNRAILASIESRKKDSNCWQSHFAAVKWYDNRSVTLLSDYVGAHPVTHVQGWDRSKALIDVPCPAVVRDYNQHMGEVDLLDSLTALYRTKIRSKKWYHHLSFHFLDMIVVTCWLLYKWDCKYNNLPDAEVMRLHAFKSYIAQGLCKSGKSLEKKRGRPSGGI